MKARLAKICSLLPFALILAVLFLIGLDYFDLAHFYNIERIFVNLWWIPSLIFSVLGIVFSALSLRERGAKICLLLSCIHCVLAFVWGILVVKLLFTGHFRIF